MWLFIIGGAISVYLILVAKTAAMNKDPRSQELATRLLAALAESQRPRPDSQKLISNEDGSTYWYPPKPIDIIEGWGLIMSWLIAATPEKSPGQRITILAHAISMIKPYLDKYDYDNFCGLGRNWNGYSY